jgi:DNA topoisomerase-1
MGLITYMRTDSTRVSDEALVQARTLIVNQWGEKYLPPSPRLYGKKKNAQDAHEAIRPSQIVPELSPDRVKDFLSKDQYKLYELIWKRFLASQMENAAYDATRIDIAVDNCMFRATGSIQTFDGFLKVYDEAREEAAEKEDGENDEIPLLTTGMALTCKDLQGKQHFTQPPPRYTEASLVRELEEKGIGRPSTYAQIIDTLRKRKYVTMDSRRFIPTDVGTMVSTILCAEFSDIFNVGFTAGMEGNLDSIENGEAEWVSVLRTFYDPFKERLAGVMTRVKDIRANNQEITDRICPTCNEHPLVMKWSRNGKFYACQGFPNCKYTEPADRVAPVQSDEKCDKCGAPMVILSLNNSRFLGCSRYPECKSTRSLSTGVHCPREGCEGSLVEKRTRKGKNFYGCNTYPKCQFATWDRPLNKTCPQCNYPIMVLRETKTKGTSHICPNCKNAIPVEDTPTPNSPSGEPMLQE